MTVPSAAVWVVVDAGLRVRRALGDRTVAEIVHELGRDRACLRVDTGGFGAAEIVTDRRGGRLPVGTRHFGIITAVMIILVFGDRAAAAVGDHRRSRIAVGVFGRRRRHAAGVQCRHDLLRLHLPFLGDVVDALAGVDVPEDVVRGRDFRWNAAAVGLVLGQDDVWPTAKILRRVESGRNGRAVALRRRRVGRRLYRRRLRRRIGGLRRAQIRIDLRQALARTGRRIGLAHLVGELDFVAQLRGFGLQPSEMLGVRLGINLWRWWRLVGYRTDHRSTCGMCSNFAVQALFEHTGPKALRSRS